MSSPSKIKKDTLQTLRGTRRDMSRAKFLNALKRQPKSVRTKAAHARLDVEQALLELGNAKIAKIGDKLSANETDLRDGLKDLKKARANLTKVKDVLGKVNSVLKVISKVLKFVATG